MQLQKEERLVRLSSIIGDNGVIPISKSSWHAGVRSGIYPSPIKIGPNMSAYKWSEIQALCENGIVGGNQ